MHDAVGFARITASGAGRTFTAPGWQFDGEFLYLNWEDDVETPGNERIPPGVTAGSIIEITDWDATFDVSFMLERNKNRFYVSEAGEFFVKVRTNTANWRYVDGSYEPCDSASAGTVYDRTVDSSCPDPLWIKQANKVQMCDIVGPLCKRGTDDTDCAPLGFGGTVAYDATYASVQTLGADDDTCDFSGNGFCEDSGVNQFTIQDEAYKTRGIGAGSHVPDRAHQNPRWQQANFIFDNAAKACPRSEQEVNLVADKDVCGGGACGDGFSQGAVFANTPARPQCFLGSDVEACGTRHFTFGLDVTKPLNDGLNSYYRGQGAVSFKILEAPASSNVGPVSTGGGDELSSGMGFVIVREKTQPTVMFPVPVRTLPPQKQFCLNSQLTYVVSF